MAEPLADQIIPLIDQAVHLYHRLILVVAPSDSGKTAALREVALRRTDAYYVNLSLELSQKLLLLPERQRPLQMHKLLEDVLRQSTANIILLDNIELLFDPALKQQVLSLLSSMSRNRTLIVSWNGAVEQGELVYARPGHSEYQRFVINNFLVVCGT